MTAQPALTRPAERPLTGADILANARALADAIRQKDLAAEYDRIRRLPADIVEEIRAAGIMRMNMPKIWGGPEMTSMEQVEVIETLARADASVAWCSFIWCDSGLYSGYLEDSVAREMYPRLDMATSGWVYPATVAERVKGGFMVSGQWMFGSGCNHCDWLAAGVAEVENGAPVLDADGRPFWRILLAKREEFEILDTWYTTGLRGTGSNDYRVRDLFVPEERSFSFLLPAKRAGTLWKKPDALLRKMAGVPLGIAADAIDTAIAMLHGKIDRLSGVPYRDMPRVQLAIAEAQAKLGAARAYVFHSLETQWRKLENDEPLTERERADVWLSRTQAFRGAREVVTLLYDTIGAGAVYATQGPFDRHLRDVQTACQHIVGQTKAWEWVGQLMLGGPVTSPLL
jgi:alkylation response protein AidB-like acyl-CoA dehydrogenase